jgi:CelD/BcsL family acetyltransferase involved in cellulose biosynthesis
MEGVLEVNDLGGLQPYRADWWRLLQQTPGAAFFQSLEWLEVYWRHFGHGQRLRVLLVLEDGAVCGIVPLVVRREATRVGPLRFLTYPLDDWGSFYGPVAPEPQRALAAALRHVAATRRDWDVLELRWVAAAACDAAHSAATLQAAGFQAHRSQRGETAIIDLRCSWEEYLSARTAKWRNNLRRWERRLHERGAAEYVRYRPAGAARGDGDPRWDLYDACVDVARRSWQGSSTTGTTLCHREVCDFLRGAHAAAVAAGAADINLLLVAGRPVAFAYNYQFQGHVFGLRIGYDAQHAPDGAGNLLYAYAIRDSIQRGDRLYDLGPGSLECKRALMTQVEPIYRYSHYRPAAWRAQLIRFKRWMDERRHGARAAVSSAAMPDTDVAQTR